MCMSSLIVSASAWAERVTRPIRAIRPRSRASGRTETYLAEKDGAIAPAFSAVSPG